MARRQISIPGTDRTDVPPALLEAGEKWLDLRREKRRIGDKAKEAKAGVLMLMEMHKHPKFSLKDHETDEIMTLELDNEPKLRTKKSGEVESEMGDGLPSEQPPQSAAMDGLIAQAMKAQQDTGTEETADGDVVPPTNGVHASVPRKKRKANSAKNGKGKRA